jgi:hypothetical protein
VFWPAGTFDWPGAWIFIAEMGIVGVAISLWLLRHDPDFGTLSSRSEPAF